MKKTKDFIKVLIFNILETIIIFLLGRLFNVDMNLRIMFMVTFFLTRMIIGKPKHYNKAYRCALWSFLVFLSLYSLSDLQLPVIILLTVFTGFISTGRADINDMYLWNNGSSSKYADVQEYIEYHFLDKELLDLEEKIKNQDNLDYLIYKYRFKDKLTFSEISEKLNIDNPRIAERLDRIAFAIRLYCGI